MDATSQLLHCIVSGSTISYAVDMPYTTVWHVLHRIFGYFPQKIRRLRELSDEDPVLWEAFALQLLARMEVNAAWSWNILWTNEAHFHLNGQVNMYNYRILTREKPVWYPSIALAPYKGYGMVQFHRNIRHQALFFLKGDSKKVQNLLCHKKKVSEHVDNICDASSSITFYYI